MDSDTKDGNDSTSPRQSILKRLIRNRVFGFLCLAIAAGLFALDIIGTIIPLRNPEIYHEPRNLFTNDIVLTAGEFWKRVERQGDEPTSNYAQRVTMAVSDGVAHLHVSEESIMRKYNWKMPVWENYLIWVERPFVHVKRTLDGTLDTKGSADKYVFADYRRIVERGVGLCAQQSFVVMGVLQDAGIPVRVVAMSRHSVNEAEIEPGVWWVLDADFGVVLPYDMAALRQNPRLIEPFYTARGHGQRWLDELEPFYAEPSPIIYTSIRQAQGTLRYYFEFISYYLIWIIPAVLLVMGFVVLRLSAKEGQRSE